MISSLLIVGMILMSLYQTAVTRGICSCKGYTGPGFVLSENSIQPGFELQARIIAPLRAMFAIWAPTKETMAGYRRPAAMPR